MHMQAALPTCTSALQMDLELQIVVSHHVGCWEHNLHPLEDQQVHLTTEPSITPAQA